MTKLLVSCCNVFPPGFGLGLLDYEGAMLNWVPLDGPWGQVTGVDGLEVGLGRTFAVLQHPESRSTIVAFDESLRPTHWTRLEAARDVHAVALYDDGLLYADTARNRLGFVPYDARVGFGREQEYWRYCDDEEDVVHLNSVAVFKGHVYVSMFGTRVGGSWAQAHDGLIYDVTAGRPVCKDLFHPHTLRVVGSNLYFVESRRGLVHRLTPNGRVEVVARIAGYLRGLCGIGDTLYVGVSALRRRSKSTGVMNTPPDESGYQTDSRLVRFNADRTVEGAVTLSLYAAEVFDVSAAPLRPTVDPRDAALTRMRALEDAIDPLRTQVRVLRGGIRKLVDRGSHADALRLLQSWLEVEPDDPELNYLAAYCLQVLGQDIDEALRLYSVALAHGFDPFWVRFHRAQLLRDAGRLQEAAEDATHAVALRPESAEALALVEELTARSQSLW